VAACCRGQLENLPSSTMSTVTDHAAEQPMPRLPFHEKAVQEASKAAALASAALDEVRAQEQRLQEELVAAPKASVASLQEALEALVPTLSERRVVAQKAGEKLNMAQAAIHRERQLLFSRMQAGRNLEMARAYAHAYGSIAIETAEELTRTRSTFELATRQKMVARREATHKAYHQKASATHALGNAWRSGVARPARLEAQAKANLGLGVKWSTSWKGAGGPELFGPPPIVQRALRYVAKPPPEKVAEPAALTELKVRLARCFARVIDTFKKWDVDCDGEVTKEELRQALCSLSIPFDEFALDLLFAHLDTDGTGSIDFDELNQALRKHAPAPLPPNYVCLQVPVRREFDPVAAGAERRAVAALKKALQPALGKVADLIRDWDADGDGFVTKKEVRVSTSGLCIGGSSKACEHVHGSRPFALLLLVTAQTCPRRAMHCRRRRCAQRPLSSARLGQQWQYRAS